VHNTNTHQARQIPFHLQLEYFAYLTANHSYFRVNETELF
jgi:hypothetical protein